MTVGFESHIAESAKIRPYISVSSIGGGFNGQNTSAYSRYDAGIIFIEDVSRSFSIEVIGQLSSLHNAVTYYASGNSLTLDLREYTVGLQGMYYY